MRFPKATREAIHGAEGRPVEIDWPQGGPEAKPGRHYTVQGSHRAGEYEVIVLFADDAGEKAVVRVDDDPVRLLGKSGGYVTSASGALGAHVNPEPGGLQFRPEYEPEAVGEAEQVEITRAAREHRNLRLRARIAKAEDALSEIEGDEEFVQSAQIIGYVRNRLRKLEAKLRRDEAVDRSAA
jgi:hypothetical protein